MDDTLKQDKKQKFEHLWHELVAKGGLAARPDCILHVFQKIEADKDLMELYNRLVTPSGHENSEIAKRCKKEISWDSDGQVKVAETQCKLIESYTRLRRKKS